MLPLTPCSVIIPAYNAALYLLSSLEAALLALPRGWELIVVDDGSTDGTASIATGMGVRVVRVEHRGGAAMARNAGVEAAQGDVLIFIDADVRVHASTFECLYRVFASDPGVDAVFGSYDARPADFHLVSVYRNLLHHYHHQQGRGRAMTFWTGCGAVRRRVIDVVGPFRDASLFCMEDIEFGYRMNAAGFRVELRPKIQCTHLKRWTLAGMIKADVIRRGIPWTVMMLERRRVDNALNVSWRERGSAAAVVMLVLSLLVAGFSMKESEWFFAAGGLAAVALLTFLWLQWRFFRFLGFVRGWGFALSCFPLHLVYFGCAIIGGIMGVVVWVGKRMGLSDPG